MGELLILQPDEKFSPSHNLLPQGSGLYLLHCPLSEPNDTGKKLRAAKLTFLNTPHPLEILSERSAYGSGGTIQRDHDMNSYLKTVRSVIRQELNQIRKSMREKRRKVWWPLVLPRRVDTSIVVGRSMVSVSIGQRQSPFSGMMKTGRESLKRFSRLVASQHMHLFVLLFFPARMLILGAYSLISLRWMIWNDSYFLLWGREKCIKQGHMVSWMLGDSLFIDFKINMLSLKNPACRNILHIYISNIVRYLYSSDAYTDSIL